MLHKYGKSKHQEDKETSLNKQDLALVVLKYTTHAYWIQDDYSQLGVHMFAHGIIKLMLLLVCNISV